MDIIARAEHQGSIGRCFFALNLLVDFSRELVRVEINYVFFKRLSARDHFSGCVQYEARSVKYQAVVASHLIHHCYRNFMMAGNCGQHLVTQLALAQPERRSGDVEQEISARVDQGFHRVEGIKPLVPELLVVPGIFADGQRHLLAAKWKQHLALGWGKISHFVEDVVGGQQHLRLQKRHSAFFEQRGGVHY